MHSREDTAVGLYVLEQGQGHLQFVGLAKLVGRHFTPGEPELACCLKYHVQPPPSSFTHAGSMWLFHWMNYCCLWTSS